MRLRSERAFTLFELIIAIAIVGLIMGIVVGRMDQYLELDMKKASNRLGSTIRYLYNKSATDGIYVRLVLDLDERTYWVEATSDPTRVSADMEAGSASSEEGEEDSEAASEEGEPGMGEKPKLKYPKPSFGQVDSFLLKATKLPDPVFFKDVFVEHRRSAVEGGKVAIYFFPNGYVEHAIINLRNEDDDYFYSIETNPVTGKVSIENEYRTMEGK
jgi:prepilin-type N-terminal cleavage/methylation domain-containing protein